MLCWHHLSADRPGGFALRGGLSGRFGAPLSSLAYDSALPPSGCCRVTSSMRCKGSSCAGAGRQGAWLASADTRQPHGRLALGKKAELWSGVGDCLMHCCDFCLSRSAQQGFRLRDRSSRCLSPVSRSSFASWLLMLLGLSLPTPLVGWLCSH